MSIATGIARQRVLAPLLALGLLASACGLVVSKPPKAEPVVAWWNAELVAQDSSGLGNHGFKQGDPESGMPGHRGTAYAFHEAGSWVRVPSTPDLNPGKNDFLISAWVDLRSTPQGRYGSSDLVRKGRSTTTTGDFKLEIVPPGRPSCTASDSQGRRVEVRGPNVDLADGRWHRVGCGRTHTRWSVLLDDIIVSKRVHLSTITNVEALSIGSKYGEEDATDGLIDDVAFYIVRNQRAGASANQTRLHQQIRAMRSPANAVGIWHLDEPAPGWDPVE